MYSASPVVLWAKLRTFATRCGVQCWDIISAHPTLYTISLNGSTQKMY